MKRGTKVAGATLAGLVILGGGLLATDVAQQSHRVAVQKTPLSATVDEYAQEWEKVKRAQERVRAFENAGDYAEQARKSFDEQVRADRVARGLPAEPTAEETAYTASLTKHTEAMLDVVQTACAWDGGDWDARLHGTNYGWCTSDASGRGADVALSHTRTACDRVRGTWTESADRFPDMKSAREAVVIVGATDAVNPVTGTCVMVYGGVS